jgi:hypothetical protein
MATRPGLKLSNLLALWQLGRDPPLKFFVSVDSKGVRFVPKSCLLSTFLKRSLRGILRKEAPAGNKRNSNKRKSGGSPAAFLNSFTQPDSNAGAANVKEKESQ